MIVAICSDRFSKCTRVTINISDSDIMWLDTESLQKLGTIKDATAKEALQILTDIAGQVEKVGNTTGINTI